MFKYTYLVFIVLFFISCVSPKYNTVNTYINISDKSKQFTYDSCVFNSYVLNISSLEYGNIFIEKVNLNNNCEWNGFQRSYFDDLFKEKTRVKTMISLERINFPTYEFSTYLINDKYIMNLIYKFSTDENMFILDYEGKLFINMIKQFDKNYKNRYLLSPRFSSTYNSSLVKQNIIKNYFNKEIEPFE